MSRKLIFAALIAAGLSVTSATADPLGVVSVSASAPGQVACQDITDEQGERIGSAFGVFEVSGSSKVADTLAFARQVVRIDVNGTGVAYGETDLDGNFAVTVSGIQPGVHDVVAVVSGSTPLSTASETMQVEVTGTLSYADADGDGFGDGGTMDCTEEVAPGRTLADGDCDDSDPAINPDAEDVPGNEIDEDCDLFTGP